MKFKQIGVVCINVRVGTTENPNYCTPLTTFTAKWKYKMTKNFTPPRVALHFFLVLTSIHFGVSPHSACHTGKQATMTGRLFYAQNKVVSSFWQIPHVGSKD